MLLNPACFLNIFALTYISIKIGEFNYTGVDRNLQLHAHTFKRHINRETLCEVVFYTCERVIFFFFFFLIILFEEPVRKGVFGIGCVPKIFLN